MKVLEGKLVHFNINPLHFTSISIMHDKKISYTYVVMLYESIDFQIAKHSCMIKKIIYEFSSLK
jgi:hypothetical protein